ncbi:hypothetical protein WJR50_30165 [Catalinimonas sp. 4WD22]|uniref:hypothetical protein n=1 Tax=Catalinimonas locisalis TaxID=3133978 RepID=UPI003101A0CD
MTRRDLNKLTFICRKEQINFHVKKIVDGNYSIFISEERRSITPNFKSYSLAKEKIDQILYLREHNMTYDEWLREKS